MGNSNTKFWDNTAFLYSNFMKNNDAVYCDVCTKISPYFNADSDVLEIACGTGQFTKLLSSQSKTFIATDFSSKMIENCSRLEISNNVSFTVEDATNLSFADNSFDIVLMANAMHIMPNPEIALKEIKRVLKSSGLLIAPTFIYDTKMPKLREFFIEQIGFKPFNKWKSHEISKFVENNGYKVISNEIINGKPLSECIIIASL